MIVIVGLGNPGPQYRDTRHNIGRRAVELWSRRLKTALKNRRFQSMYVRTSHRSRDLTLICPMTYMNLSGKAVKAWAERYRVPPDKILVIHDDLDLPTGRVKVSRSGGAGGHKGVISIMDHLGSREFPRVKIGIGRPRRGEAVEDYVLSPFYEDENEIMETALDMAVQACELFVSGGIELAMRRVNGQNAVNKEGKS